MWQCFSEKWEISHPVLASNDTIMSNVYAFVHSHQNLPGNKVSGLIAVHLWKKTELSRYIGVNLERKVEKIITYAIYILNNCKSIWLMHHMKCTCAWFWGLTSLEIYEKGFSSRPTSRAWKISPENVQNQTGSMQQDWREDWLQRYGWTIL